MRASRLKKPKGRSKFIKDNSNKLGYCMPPPAPRDFPPDFPMIRDHKWGYPLGGWGGIRRAYPLTRNPVVFIHGNTRDASDWDEPGKSVKEKFLQAGYSLQELWAVSYNGASQRGRPSPCRTDNTTNMLDIYDFILAVIDYTGAEKVDIIAHSLGVTIVRRLMHEDKNLYHLIENFVGIAGPNHGTSACRSLEGVFIGCDEIYPGSPWLKEMNGANGNLETIEPTKYMTIYDGTGADVFYQRDDTHSPKLKGAYNTTFPGLNHDELRVSDEPVSAYLNFLMKSHESKVNT